jgi:hypothetical protein
VPKNEYKLSLGGRRQKPIGELNSPRIGDKVELKKIPKFLSGKVWKGLERSGKS